MGDVLTLVEKAESSIKEEDAQEMTRRMMSANFDFNDFLKQYKMVSGMGSMGQIMKMLPGTHQAEYCVCIGSCHIMRVWKHDLLFRDANS